MLHRRSPPTRSSASALPRDQLVQQRDNPGQVATQVAMNAVYGSRHPYGYTEIGTEASVAIKSARHAGVLEGASCPNNAALIVAGDISIAELRVLAEKAFGVMTARVSDAAGARARPPTARMVIVDKPGSPQTQLRVTGNRPRAIVPDFRPLQVMNKSWAACSRAAST